MKTLLLVRHAKSSWENFSVPDIERPLNERGKKNAPEMARRLLDKKINIDAFLSSPAKRARTTAEYFCKVYHVSPKDILVFRELYEPTQEAFLEVIKKAPPGAATIAIFSHNPGISEFANAITTVNISDMPTGSVFAIKCRISTWPDFEAGKNDFYFFDYPKANKQND